MVVVSHEVQGPVDGERQKFLEEGMAQIAGLDSGLVRRDVDVAEGRRAAAPQDSSRRDLVREGDNVGVPVMVQEPLVDFPYAGIGREYYVELAGPFPGRAQRRAAGFQEKALLAAGGWNRAETVQVYLQSASFAGARKIRVARAGIEPATPGFSDQCSTTELPRLENRRKTGNLTNLSSRVATRRPKMF